MGEAKREIAFVTGAAQGIGLAIAQRLARGGFRVVLMDRNEAGSMPKALRCAPQVSMPSPPPAMSRRALPSPPLSRPRRALM